MKVAVAIALYNGERFIEEQLETLYNQTRKPDQVVLCDDGSKDNTLEIVENYIQRHGLQQSWRVERNPQNLGYIKNFYRAISLCEADVVFLSDQDDIWALDKIEKMTQVMEEHENIALLSCKSGIVDADGKPIHSIMHKEVKEDGTIKSVAVKDIMRAYSWPGMLMCIRKDFFTAIQGSIARQPIPHDLAFAICAADKQAFYEYNYVGAFHRRHNNNTAREEHRVFKLLDLERKVKDITETSTYMIYVIDARLPITEESYRLIQYKLEYLNERKACLQNRKMRALIRLYRSDSEKMFRIVSLVCDIWIILFGKYNAGGKHDGKA